MVVIKSHLHCYNRFSLYYVCQRESEEERMYLDTIVLFDKYNVFIKQYNYKDGTDYIYQTKQLYIV